MTSTPQWGFTCLGLVIYLLHQTFSMLPAVDNKRLHMLCSLSPPSTESLDWENDPDPLPTSPWDLPLGGGGKERSGEAQSLILSHLKLHMVFLTLGRFQSFWSHHDSHAGMKYDTYTYRASSPFIMDLAERVSWCPGGGEPSGECHLCGGE